MKTLEFAIMVALLLPSLGFRFNSPISSEAYWEEDIGFYFVAWTIDGRVYDPSEQWNVSSILQIFDEAYSLWNLTLTVPRYKLVYKGHLGVVKYPNMTFHHPLPLQFHELRVSGEATGVSGHVVPKFFMGTVYGSFHHEQVDGQPYEWRSLESIRNSLARAIGYSLGALNPNDNGIPCDGNCVLSSESFQLCNIHKTLIHENYQYITVPESNTVSLLIYCLIFTPLILASKSRCSPKQENIYNRFNR